MSNLDPDPGETLGRAGGDDGPAEQLLRGPQVPLGGLRGMTVTRTLPHRERRMVGAWCFLDAYGPVDLAVQPGMRVPPHPHTGLQTVSWLLHGHVLHHDSLANAQSIEPGQLSLMTAGAGIAHSEQTPAGAVGLLHGVQLWVALPDAARRTPPRFENHGDLPVLVDGGARVTVFVGSLAGAVSPARMHSPIVGAQVALAAGARIRVPVEPAFEHAVLVLDGEVSITPHGGAPNSVTRSLGPATAGARSVSAGPLLYLGTGRTALELAAERPAVALLLGGEPFGEQLVMWWNFVDRSHEGIVEAREDWIAGRRFGPVTGYPGDRLPAPALPTVRLKPRGRRP